MIKKIIFTIIIAIIVILLGFGACKNTNAYTDETSGGMEPLTGYLGFYSFDVGGLGKGGTISQALGDNFDWDLYDSGEYYYYILSTNYQNSRNYFICLNFYSTFNKYYMQIISIIDGDIIYQKNTFEVNKDNYLLVAINPLGDDGYIYFKEYSLIPEYTPSDDYWNMSLSYVKDFNVIYDTSNLGLNVDLSLTYNSNYHGNYLYGRHDIDNTMSYNSLFNWFKNNQLFNIDRIINKGLQYGYQTAQYELEQQTALNYSKGYQAGLSETEGYQTGYSVGYQAGVDDTMSGSSGVSPVLSLLTSLAAPITAIMGIRLAPNITIGTLVFIPLFFAALGLVLWIWRRN